MEGFIRTLAGAGVSSFSGAWNSSLGLTTALATSDSEWPKLAVS
jgi:hypothetical protein